MKSKGKSSCDLSPDDIIVLLSFVITGLSVGYITNMKKYSYLALLGGIFFILFALTSGDLGISLCVASLVSVSMLIALQTKTEGFANESDEDDDEDKAEKKTDKTEKKKKKKSKTAPPPDNGTRAEMFELGKKYKAPSEEDDKEFHLDAGTTFLNAYKSLKPDQVAAMTKDTQDLMQTQKQLMSTLNTLKPLIQDGKEMMNMFQSYFGSNGAAGQGAKE